MLKYELIKYLAKKHIAGPTLDDAVKICRRASESGWRNTLSVWTGKNAGAEEHARKYLEILNSIVENDFDSYLSIKPSGINFSLKTYESLAHTAVIKHTRIHFDSLSPDLTDLYISFLKKAITIYENAGFTLPSRWNRSLKDADEISGLKIPVRVVKGQWGDPGHQKVDPKKNYLRIVDKLCGRVPLIAIATHDRQVADEAINLLDKNNCDFELEQFFSLPLIVNKIPFDKDRIRKRIYVVYGEPYLPYDLRSANKRPGMILWILHDAFHFKSDNAFDNSNKKNLHKEYHDVTRNKIPDKIIHIS